MAPRSPYDRTTPPLTPQPNTHSGYIPVNMRPDYASRGFDPRDAHPAVWPQTPRPSPREYGPEDDLYYTFTRDAYLNSPSLTTRQLSNLNVNSPRPPQSNNQFRSTQPPRTISNTKGTGLRLTPHATTFRDMQATKVVPLSTRSPAQFPEPAQLVESRKSSTTAAVVEWASRLVHKKRRPSEIFNMEFAFHIPSQRRSADRTPEISPRTSFSTASTSPEATTKSEPFKRQRIDSTDSEAAFAGFPFGKPTPVDSPRGRALGSPGMLPRGDSPPCAYAEAHPGRLVDFSSPCVADEPSLPLSEDSTSTAVIDAHVYHNSLAISPRRKSFPTGAWAARRGREEAQMLARLENLDAEARDFSGAGGRSVGARKRACTLERKDSTRRTGTGLVDASLRAEEASLLAQGGASVPSRRTMSDPCAEAFLKHVRASLQARRERDERCRGAKRVVDYPVFADETEKGFLDDEPL